MKRNDSQPELQANGPVAAAKTQASEERLRETERKYEQLVRYAPAAIYEIDFRRRRFTSVNDAMCVLSGYTRPELLAMDPLEILDDEGKVRFAERLRKWFSGEQPSENVEYRVRAKDGRVHDVVLNATYTSDESGKPLGATVVAHDVTERRRMEEELRRSREQYRDLVEGCGCVILRVDKELRITYINEFGLEFFGFTRDELIGKRALDTIIPKKDEQGRDFAAMAEDIIRRPETFRTNIHQNVCKDGRLVWMSWTNRPIYDARGELVEILVIGNDYSKLKEAEKALRASEERFRALASATFEGIAVTEAGRITDANDQFLDMVGYSREELLGMEVAALIPEADRERVLRNVIEGRESHIEHQVIRRDGKVITVEAHGRTIAHQDRKVRFTAVQDITERKLTEERIRRSELRLRLAIDAAFLISFDWDIQRNEVRRYVSTDPALGATREEAPSTFEAVREVVHPDDRERFTNNVRAAMERRDGRYENEFRIVHPDGTIAWLHERGRVEKDADGRPVRLVGLSQDVTERKEFQAELERLVAERTAKLQELVGELEHFSYTITHDMRAPLRAMRGFAELVKDMSADSGRPEVLAFLQRIVASAERMDLLITDALNYSKAVREELALAPVDLGALLRGMLDSYPEFQRNRAHIDLQGEFPPVMANEAGLTQCFSNLLGNAVKFVAPGATPEVRVRSEVHDGWVRIWVEDKGIGIPPTMLPRLFHMFSRGQHDYDGTGIGLALVRKVVERMRGRVGVESELGKGSRFWVDLRPGDVRRPQARGLRRDG